MSEMSLGQAVDRAIDDAMVRDKSIVLIGEDAPLLRAPLLARFGADRILAAPISESAFFGAAAGAAMAGLRPVVELYMVDFIADYDVDAFEHIRIRAELRARGVASDRIELVYNGIDPALFKPRPKNLALLAEQLDRRLSKVIEIAYRHGAYFDSWDECFNYQLYLDAFRQCNIEPAFYAHRERGENELLPWEHLAGENKQQLFQRGSAIKDKLENEE